MLPGICALTICPKLMMHGMRMHTDICQSQTLIQLLTISSLHKINISHSERPEEETQMRKEIGVMHP